MSWSDIFYPGNSEKKTILADCSKLKDLLEDCFESVNDLIDCIEENFPGEKIAKIDVQQSASLGDNCSIIIDRANQIEKLLDEIGFDVEERMDTKLFKQLKDMKTKFEKQIEMSRKINYSIAFIVIIVAWNLMAITLSKEHVSEYYFSPFVGIFLNFLILPMLAVLIVGICIVLSAIYGAFESYMLEHALEVYTRAVEDFGHAARQRELGDKKRWTYDENAAIWCQFETSDF